jgi:hypothetical protein
MMDRILIAWMGSLMWLVGCPGDPDDLTPSDDDDTTPTDDDDDDATPTDDDDTTPADDDDSALDVELSMTVGSNPHNPFSALVEVTANRDLGAVVEYGEAGSFDLATPEVSLAAGQPEEILVLGLRAELEYELRVVATDGVDSWSTSAAAFTPEPLPGDWPSCWVEFSVAESEFDSQEALCTHGISGGGDWMFYCVDRWGVPVFRVQHPDNLGISMLRPLRSGAWAGLGSTDSMLMRFDARGELVEQWPPLFFSGLTRFEHDWIDMHDVLELTEGPWEGALAFLTACSDDVQGETLEAGGIIVFDADTEQVLWDWCAHGAAGDGIPIDPLLDYDRETLGDDSSNWMHTNALLHGLNADDSQFFWLSAREQDWLIKIDVATDAVEWRLGYAGDFVLVEDLDDPSSPELPAVEWFFHQHAPDWVERAGTRIRFLVFDNGNVRADENGGVLDAPTYSRVMEFAIDEQTRRASPVFEYGESDPANAGHFFSGGDGDADLSPDEDAVLFTVGWGRPSFIGDISYPGAQERWRYACDVEADFEAMYRVNYYPTLYDTAWRYGQVAATAR